MTPSELQPALRRLRIGWLVSLLLLAWLGWLAAVNPVRALMVLVLVLLVPGLVLGAIVLPKQGVVRVGYWFFAPRKVTSLHFLPPRELSSTRRGKSLTQALRELRIFLSSLEAHGIRVMYAETNLSGVERLGFRPLWTSTPLTWLLISLQHRMATGKWNLRWPRMYVYIGNGTGVPLA
jgi:hypothetical protein